MEPKVEDWEEEEISGAEEGDVDGVAATSDHAEARRARRARDKAEYV